MTHLDTLRRMRDARRSCRCMGREPCCERAALEEAIRVMERDAAAEGAELSDRVDIAGTYWIVDDRERLAELRARYPDESRETAARLRATARALETP